MSLLPLKSVLLILRVVCNVVAVLALPERLPITLPVRFPTIPLTTLRLPEINPVFAFRESK